MDIYREGHPSKKVDKRNGMMVVRKKLSHPLIEKTSI